MILDPVILRDQGLLGRQSEGRTYTASGSGHLWVSPVGRWVYSRTADERLVSRLDALFEEAPVEDGYEHPAEEIIQRALLSEPGMRSLIQRLLSDSRYRHRVALLRCVGRLPASTAASWALALVRGALADDDLETRDAAIRAIELWATPEAIQLLRQHNEPNPWLSDYARRVLAALAR